MADRLTLQWHITEKCNLNCRHCYQDAPVSPDPNLPALIPILDQFLDLLDQLERRRGKPVSAHVTLTGGEPFLRQDFFELLAVLTLRRNVFSYGILTNGTLIERRMATMLADFRPAYVQVSLDGGRETHDRIRGNGAFEAACRGIRQLRKVGIPVWIAFTAHSGNFKEFGTVAATARRLKADRVWADRMVPLGRGASLKTVPLSPDDTRRFMEIMATARIAAKRAWFNRTTVAMHRALQFKAGGPPYHCRAGDELIAVMPNGDLVPCRRMPITVGNLFQEQLADLYFSAPLFLRLRDPECIPESCGECPHRRKCRGGLKCLAYAMHGDPFRRDPGCWSG